MIYVGDTVCWWDSTEFRTLTRYGIDYPQVLVAEYPFSDKWFFEISDTLSSTEIRDPFIDKVKALSGSFIDGKTGNSFDRGIFVPVDFVRLPTSDEIKFYEEHSRL